MSVALIISQRIVGDVTVLELGGRLVFDEGARAFREQIVSLVSAGRTRILLDLRNVTYIDSCGVGGLVSMFLHVLKRGGDLKLICPSWRARRVLKISQLLSVFEVFQTEEQGINSFGRRNGIAAGPSGT